MRRIFAIVVLLCLALGARAQWSIDLGAGWLSGYHYDRMLSPLNYTNSATDLSLGTSYEWQNSRVGLDITATFGSGETSIDAPLDSYGAKINLDYLHRVWQPCESFSLWAGGAYRFDVDFYNYQTAAYSYLLSHSLRPTLNAQWQWGQHSLIAKGSLYLVGLVGRPPYNMIPEYGEQNNHDYTQVLWQQLGDVELMAWNKYFDFNIGVEYLFELNRTVSLGIGYEFAYKVCSVEEPLSIFDNTIELKLRLRL